MAQQSTNSKAKSKAKTGATANGSLGKAKTLVTVTKGAIDVIKEARPLVEEHGPVVVEQVSQKAKQAGKVLNNARGSILEKLEQRKAASKSKKERAEARRLAVSQSLTPLDAKEFFKNFEAGVSPESDLRNGYMGVPGCYAILTMKSAREGDLTNYKDVFVGCSDKIGFDVYSQLRGFGNIDVYADYKYNAPMKILAFLCEKEELEERYIKLLDDLQAIDSYNKWDALESLEVQSE